MENFRFTNNQTEELTTLPSTPASSSSSAVTVQVESDEEIRHKEQYEAAEFHYISNEIRVLHSLLLQASDVTSEDPNACREHCFGLISSNVARKSPRTRSQKLETYRSIARIVKCGALYLLAACSESDGRRQEAKGFLEQAFLLCDEMDRVNEKQGVIAGMVPYERVHAMRAQLSKIQSTISSSKVVVISRRTTPNSSRASSQYSEKRVRLLTAPVTIDNKPEVKEESCSSNTSFTTAPQSNLSDRDRGVTRVDRCHITELEFELSRAREEESNVKRKVHQARKKRERIEEKLIKARRLRELQKV